MAEIKQETPNGTISESAAESNNDNTGSSRMHDPEWNELNQLTLSVMSNRNRYDKYKKIVANTSDTVIETFNKEKAYYKPRILAMTRDLFDERCENEDINRAHEDYLKYCIDYLKWSDITEMVGNDNRSEVREDVAIARQELQRKIVETSLIEPEVETGPAGHEPEPEPSPAPAPAPAPESTITGIIMSFANKMCIRKKTMDDFIVMKPIPGNSDEEINARLPKIRDYQTEIMKRSSA
jgi:hypothetical protein